jgi:hypothetical protein
LRLKRVLVILGLVLVVSFVFGQTTSSDFPPEELLQRITVAGLRAHMAFLADDLMEGRGTGTRGYQLAANYVRAQFEQMGLQPAGGKGSFFQNVHFRKIELLQDKSSFMVNHNGSTRTLTIDKDYVMRGDPVSDDTTAEGQVVFVGYGVSAPESMSTAKLWQFCMALHHGFLLLRAPIFLTPNKNCAWLPNMEPLEWFRSGRAK